MGSLQYEPALVMYPDCGPVWYGQSSVCASPSRHLRWSRRPAVSRPKMQGGGLLLPLEAEPMKKKEGGEREEEGQQQQD